MKSRLSLLWIAVSFALASSCGVLTDGLGRSAAESRALVRLAPSAPRVPSGSLVTVRLLRTISSTSARPGDRWVGRVTTNLTVENRVVLPAGSLVTGRIVAVRNAGRSDRALVQLAARSVTVNGRTTPIGEGAARRWPAPAEPFALERASAPGIPAALAEVAEPASRPGVSGGLTSRIVAPERGEEIVLRRGAVLAFTLSETLDLR